MRESAIKALAALTISVSACSTTATDATPRDWADTMLSPWFEAPSRVHQAVQFHEREPLSKTAAEIQPILAAHYKSVDYIICGDVLGPLFDSDHEVHHTIGWQIIFASGDWVESHPDESNDIDAYTLAGLRSGLRTYATILDQDALAKSDLLDELLALELNDDLERWYESHPCGR